MVEESDSGAEQNRRDVDGDLVEEPGIEALLDRVGAVDGHGLPVGRPTRGAWGRGRVRHLRGGRRISDVIGVSSS
jgi:hypothetical protein